MKRRSLSASLGLLAAAALLTGCAGSVPSVPQAVSQLQESSSPAAAAVAAADDPLESVSALPTASVAAAGAEATSLTAVSITDAVRLVLAQYPDATPVKCALELEGGKIAWDVEVLAADGAMYDAAVDAQTGALIYARSDSDLPDIAAGDVVVGYAQAVQSAVDLYPNCFVEDFEIEKDNGVVFYDIELRDAQDQERAVFVNARTGEVTNGSFGSMIGGGTAAAPYNQTDPDDLDDYDDYYEDDYDDYYPGNATQTVAPASGNGYSYGHHGQYHHEH